MLTDALVVAFNLAIGTLSLLGTRYSTSVLVAGLGLAVLEAVALWWRRTRPATVLLVVVCATLALLMLGPDRDPSSPALAFAVYAASAYGGRRVRLWVAGVAIVLIAVAVALLVPRDFEAARKVLPAGATSLVAWVAGDYMRSRRQFFLDMVARHRQEREQAAEEERLRIARELHDVVAHNVSLMAIQAGAARMSGQSTADALQTIETTARDTIAELNRLLGVLRKDSDGAARSPQPSLAQVDALVRPARDAGLGVTVTVSGGEHPLPAALDLSAYRIVQEAITNVLKHANASRVEVLIDYQPDALLLTVSDNGSGVQEVFGASSGHGLIGMRERVELFGGELGAGSSSLGGFTVRARLPLR